MKFDKFMDILFRIFLIFTTCVMIITFIISYVRPLKASAIGEVDTIASDIRDFYDDYKHEMDRIEQALASDITNGTIDASSALGQQYMGALALQAAVINNPSLYTAYLLANAYNDGTDEANKFLSYLENNPSITFSDTAGVGLYQVSGFNDYRIANIHFYDNALFSEGKIPLVTSNDFEVYFTLSETSNYTCTASAIDPYYNFSCAGNWWAVSIASSNSLGFIDLSNWGAQSGRYVISSSVPVLTSIPDCPVNGNNSICGNMVSEELPNETVSIENPWEYYNDTLLSYLHSNFPDVNVNYYVFPNGYHNSNPDPTEPPTFPNGGINIENQYNIGINIIYPTDSNGQPVTDASGETVTETEYITDTSPLDGEYSFKMPTLARLNMVDATLPNPDISDYSNGINFVWNMCYNILTDSGFMPVVMIVFALALFGFILWKLGG